MVFRDFFVPKAGNPTEPERFIGKIIHLSNSGWGFITSEDVKFERIFFHWTGLEQDTLRFPNLTNGMKVEFTPKEYEDRGLRAIKIKVIE